MKRNKKNRGKSYNLETYRKEFQNKFDTLEKNVKTLFKIWILEQTYSFNVHLRYLL